MIAYNAKAWKNTKVSKTAIFQYPLNYNYSFYSEWILTRYLVY